MAGKSVNRDADASRSWTIERVIILVAAAITIPAGIAGFMQWVSPNPSVVIVGPEVPPQAERLDKKYPPLEQAFQVTPISFGSDLTTTIKKTATETGGQLRLFACGTRSAKMSYVGETAYSASDDKFDFSSHFPETSAVLLMQIEPASGPPVTVLAPWDLGSIIRLREPESRPGLLNCVDIKGQF